MTAPRKGEPAPEFELPATGGETVRLSELRGRTVALFFYPKANTPGCTQEGQDFRDLHEHFEALGVVVLGISRDGLKAQENFRAKHEFPFRLLSDKDEQACAAYQVIKDKTMFGKPARGIQRSTFLIDRNGVLREEWRNVKVNGHAAEVLEAARGLADASGTA